MGWNSRAGARSERSTRISKRLYTVLVPCLSFIHSPNNDRVELKMPGLGWGTFDYTEALASQMWEVDGRLVCRYRVGQDLTSLLRDSVEHTSIPRSGHFVKGTGLKTIECAGCTVYRTSNRPGRSESLGLARVSHHIHVYIYSLTANVRPKAWTFPLRRNSTPRTILGHGATILLLPFK